METLQDPLEIFINIFNSKFFFGEFTHGDNKIIDECGQEIEVADSVIVLNDTLIVFQVKRRNNKTTDVYKEDAWYDNKVLKTAKNQIRNTLKLLKDEVFVNIRNQYGYDTQIDYSKITRTYKIIVFYNDSLSFQKQEKIYKSKKVGLIHIFEISQYQDICNTLLTPLEFTEYLNFRESIYCLYGIEINNVIERVLLGQFILGYLETPPKKEYIQGYFSLNREDFRIRHLILNATEHHINSDYYDSEIDFYVVLQEFARMHRAHFRRLEKLFTACVNSENDPHKSRFCYRGLFDDLDLGVVFIAANMKDKDLRRRMFETVTLLAKYSLKVRKMIGVLCQKESGGMLIEWLYTDFQWVNEPEKERILKENNPFTPLTGKPEPYFDIT